MVLLVGGNLGPGKPNLSGRLSTVDLLVQTGQLIILFTYVTKQPTLIRMSTVQSLPLKLVFPSGTLQHYLK
jgi:hypothetical protein